MDEFPNSDEEFELMHQEELELMRANESSNNKSIDPRKQLSFPAEKSSESFTLIEVNNSSQDDSFENDFSPLPCSQHDKGSQILDTITETLTCETISKPVASKKRNLEALNSDNNKVKGLKRTKIDQDYEDTINRILELREQLNPNLLFALTKNKTLIDKRINAQNISWTVPKYLFVPVTKSDGQKFYLRCHSETYEKEETKKIIKEKLKLNPLGDVSKDMWKEANKIINEFLNKNSLEISENLQIGTIVKEPNRTDDQLWVDLYKPKSYYQLLSDETSNSLLLRWLKMWDQVVFKQNLQKINSFKKNFGKQKNFIQKGLELQFDELGRPEKKIALLCGPPGLGKTTLAHIVAKQAGYNAVEINASDDRSLNAFKNVLKNATQMRPLIDKENRPNCLIFDEIDGAPATSIDYLIKFVSNSVRKTKKNNKKTVVPKRPIICICNDVYVPALRPVRQMALVLTFPPTASERLVLRLCDIARQQGIKSDLGTLLALSEKTNNDIRSCIGILHFFKNINKPLTFSDVLKCNLGEKDVNRGFFSVLQDIFQIKRNKLDQLGTDQYDNFKMKNRMREVLSSVGSYGDYEKLAQGIFENYPKIFNQDSMLSEICEAMDWFSYFDTINTKIRTVQNYSLTQYLPFAFVVWHFVFASFDKPKLTFPKADYELRTKLTKNLATVRELLKGMQPSVRINVNVTSLIFDVIPYLIRLIVPHVKSVNLHFSNDDEKAELRRVVNVMIDYNLTYVQERDHNTGLYGYLLEPNLGDISTFSVDADPLRTVSYATKQIIFQEKEKEKIYKSKKDKKVEKNHLQAIKSKVKQTSKTPTVIRRDFFGRIIKSPNAEEGLSNRPFDVSKKDDGIWYHFNEGYTNAVKVPLKISQFK